MKHTKQQKDNINSFLSQLKEILIEHQIQLDVPVKVSSVECGYLGSLEYSYGELYIVDEDTFVELYSTVKENDND